MPLTCKHPKASHFIKAGLYEGITHFAQLEERISKIEIEKEKGDAFEVFVEAYLATQRKHDAAEIWPSNEIPLSINKELKLPAADMGVDGVFKTHLGAYSVYQVKFRTNRPALTWREISTFLGLSDADKIENRVLITNCDNIANIVEQRTDFFCVRGFDFDRLTPDDFENILSWIKGAAVKVKMKAPLPHQIDAVNAICNGLNENSRVTATMACGTGKTLVALWTAERLKSKKILLLFPSLALIRQTLHEWLKETKIEELSYICVCSDATVAEGSDMPSVSRVDLDFSVTTNARVVKDYLCGQFDGIKIVFTTYQSARVVAEAIGSDQAFDLAIFDEAHKTAGSEGRNLTFALEDRNIKAHRRLFLTATPRHYRPQKNKKGFDDQKPIFSMDRPEVYGPRVYNLPFSRAIELGVICKYKVIISAITSSSLKAELLNRGTVNVNGDDVFARQVANQISICDAVRRYGVKKIFTFHNKVDSAKSFVSDTNAGIGSHLPGYLAMHVNGEMSTAEREKTIKDFKMAKAALISNARCLTEGVDVPAVDMVAFLSPRRSVVDIVQAAGRAMRRSDSTGKSVGYILVPLYVEQEQGETVEEAVARADYTDVWEVLNSLMEHDDMLDESIKMEAHGFKKTGTSGREYIHEVIDINAPSIALESLKETISTRSIEALYSSWDMKYGELLKYKEKFGHCNVPAPATIGNTHKELGAWVTAQRVFFKKGRLTEERVALLEKCGFIFDYQDRKTDETWNKWYQALKDYRETNGHCKLPRTYKPIPELASWVWIQRIRRNKKYGKAEMLTEEQIHLLDEIDFVWDPLDLAWETSYEKLLVFFKKNGHCLVSAELAQLHSWCRTQRENAAKRKLPDHRLKKLVEIGFTVNEEDYQAALELESKNKWLIKFRELKSYRDTHGNCDVPRRDLPDGSFPGLGAWVANQRELFKTGALSRESKLSLKELGFRFAIRKDVGTWEDRFEEAREYILEHGHCDVPKNHKKYPKLEGFVNSSRVQFNNGTLPNEKIRRLNSINFNWKALSKDKVNEKHRLYLDRLVRLIETNGNKLFLRKNDDPEFYNWIRYLRRKYNQNLLPPNIAQRLIPLGFFDNIKATASKKVTSWENHFLKLQKFKRKYSHVRVPKNGDGDPTFGQWVATMRHQARNNKLSPDKTRRLVAIGIFENNDRYTPWETHFSQLEDYKRKHGHVRVPKDGDGDFTFGQWVATMRHQARNNKLSPDKVQRLIAIGIFDKNAHYTSWETHFSLLEDYKRKHGHVRVPKSGEGNPTFGQWVATMRHQVKSRKLPVDKIDKLTRIGILE